MGGMPEKALFSLFQPLYPTLSAKKQAGRCGDIDSLKTKERYKEGAFVKGCQASLYVLTFAYGMRGGREDILLSASKISSTAREDIFSAQVIYTSPTVQPGLNEERAAMR